MTIDEAGHQATRWLVQLREAQRRAALVTGTLRLDDPFDGPRAVDEPEVVTQPDLERHLRADLADLVEDEDPVVRDIG